LLVGIAASWEESDMVRIVKQNSANGTEADSEQEIWTAIRYLDPEREQKNSDVAFGLTWIALFLLLCGLIFW